MRVLNARVRYLKCVDLHDESHPGDELGRSDGLVIHEGVVLGHLPCAPHEKTVVGPHPAVHHPDVVRDLLDLERAVVFEQDRLVLFLGGQNDSIGRLRVEKSFVIFEQLFLETNSTLIPTEGAPEATACSAYSI